MKKVYDFLMLNLGALMVAIGIAFFKIPNSFATGGVTGVSIIINGLIPRFSVGDLLVIINLLLLFVGFLFEGLEFEVKSIYSTIVVSFLVWGFGKWAPIEHSLTGDTMLELFIGILFLAAGSALLFYQNASSGGTDIIAKIINRRSHIHIGKTVLMVDFTISACAVFIFGLRIGFYSMLGVIIKGFLIDAVIRGLHTSKQVVVISKKWEDIRQYIIKELNRGVTVYRAIGGKTDIERHVLNAIMSSKETFKLKEFVTKLDEKAFIVIDDVADIYGKGFKAVDL